jgi:hypothetical protein
MNYRSYYCAEFIYKKILPPALKIWLMRFMDFKRYKLRREIINYLETELKENPDSEKEEILEILQKNPVYMIPYEYDYVPPFKKTKVRGGGGQICAA